MYKLQSLARNFHTWPLEIYFSLLSCDSRPKLIMEVNTKNEENTIGKTAEYKYIPVVKYKYRQQKFFQLHEV